MEHFGHQSITTSKVNLQIYIYKYIKLIGKLYFMAILFEGVACLL